jgi:hypothetical protein
MTHYNEEEEGYTLDYTKIKRINSPKLLPRIESTDQHIAGAWFGASSRRRPACFENRQMRRSFDWICEIKTGAIVSVTLRLKFLKRNQN